MALPLIYPGMVSIACVITVGLSIFPTFMTIWKTKEMGLDLNPWFCIFKYFFSVLNHDVSPEKLRKLARVHSTPKPGRQEGSTGKNNLFKTDLMSGELM